MTRREIFQLHIFCIFCSYCSCYKLEKSVAIQILGDEHEARRIALQYGCELGFKIVFDDDDIYLLVPAQVPNNCTGFLIRNDGKVLWAEDQTRKHRAMRSYIPNMNSSRLDLNEDVNSNISIIRNTTNQRRWNFNDPLFGEQWYLRNEGQTEGMAGNDLHVIPVWKAGFTGRGITLTALDDGIQYTHPDIISNYEPDVSTDLVDMDDDPFPEPVNKGNSHGTYSAGIMAAVANNSICGVGIAYEAKVGGTRLVCGPVTDFQEAMALLYGIDKVDVVSASWGPSDDGRRVAGPGQLASRAFQRGVRHGRGGKGIVYVWAVGNGGHQQDNCNMDGYTCSIYTLSIGALDDDGLSAFYSEPCACVMASAYVRRTRRTNPAYDDDFVGNVVVPEWNGDCGNEFEGTSAAAPMGAAIMALALQANIELTWRDIQHLVVNTAKISNSSEDGWWRNGVGHHYHLRYGFGVLDAASLVALAINWTLVGPQLNMTVVIPGRGLRKRLEVEVVSGGDLDLEDGEVQVLEHVVATVDLTFTKRGNVQLYLRSPSGTVSQLLTSRPQDYTNKALKKWPFTTVHFWGEDPRGTWTIWLEDRTGNSAITYCKLTFFGTAALGRNRQQKNYVPTSLNAADLGAIMNKEKKLVGKRLRQLATLASN